MCMVVLAASLIHNRSTHVLVGEICEIHDYALELKVSFGEGDGTVAYQPNRRRGVVNNI